MVKSNQHRSMPI